MFELMSLRGATHGEFEPDKAHSTVMGIICPPLVEIGLTVTRNLGKARASEALMTSASRHFELVEYPQSGTVEENRNKYSKFNIH